MNITKKTAIAALGCAAVVLSASAAAATLDGTNVSYSFDASKMGLFGAPTVVGDTLEFAPAAFAVNGTGSATATVNITVTALPGYMLTGFNLSEGGAYTLDGGTAYIAGFLKAVDIEGSTGNQLTSNISGSALTGSGGDWTGTAAISLPATGWGGADAVVTSVTLTLSNQLFALGAASILKDGVSLSAVTTPVPEAETYAMMLAGLGLVGFMVRRRNRSAA